MLVCIPAMKTQRNSNGFTLIELLVVITIIAILASLVFTGMAKARATANQNSSMNNLRQWGVAFNGSLTDFDNRLPTTGMNGESVDLKDKDAWFNRLPGYIKEVPLMDPLADAATPKPGQKSVWINPAVPRADVERLMKLPNQWLFSYAMNGWLTTASEPTLASNRIESASSTVLMGEQGDDKPELRTESIRAYFGSDDVLKSKENFAHFLFCDGHVALVKRSTFDPRFAQGTDNPSSAETVSAGFSYVPFVGAVFE
jgi:prepilin-type N-terminal cleavage/methylation domain-containing protein/prepilin-type processing-associated H-X9-DG protein